MISPFDGCTCLRPWMSILPPPPCPVHPPWHFNAPPTLTVTDTRSPEFYSQLDRPQSAGRPEVM